VGEAYGPYGEAEEDCEGNDSRESLAERRDDAPAIRINFSVVFDPLRLSKCVRLPEDPNPFGFLMANDSISLSSLVKKQIKKQAQGYATKKRMIAYP